MNHHGSKCMENVWAELKNEKGGQNRHCQFYRRLTVSTMIFIKMSISSKKNPLQPTTNPLPNVDFRKKITTGGTPESNQQILPL